MDMHKSHINNISKYLNNSQSPLGQVIEKAHGLQDVYNDLVLELGSQFRDHFWIGTYQNGLLTILVDSAILATKLRFSIPTIRDKLRKNKKWFDLTSIETKIMVTMPSILTDTPSTANQSKNHRLKSLPLSAETIEQINNIADDLEKTPGNQEVAHALRGIVTISQAD